jgi:hypothetical protein
MRFTAVLVAVCLCAACGVTRSVVQVAPSDAQPRLWEDRGDSASLNLRYGAGSPDRAPKPPYKFIEELREGESPKFYVSDARGVVWRVKLGPEANAETAASRLVWAAGYFAEEVYYFDEIEVEGLPRLSRGREFISQARVVCGARFEPRRKEEIERAGRWDWDNNPFVGSRELDGLRVLMVLMNNYDARGANNRVLLTRSPDGQRLAWYAVTDLGASFGTYGGLGGHRSKSDLDDYRKSRFIAAVDEGTVRFAYSTRPEGLGLATLLINPAYAAGERKKQRDMQEAPLTSVEWIGSILARLSDRQLDDAFESAGYDGATAAGFASVVRDRINQLARLQGLSHRSDRADR